MQCKNCGAQIPEESQFCLVCGQKVGVMPPEIPITANEKKRAANGKNYLIIGGLVLVALVIVAVTVFCGARALGIAKVEHAIAEIGTVTMESWEQIEAAEAMVAELSEPSREKVDNLDVLSEARQDYERMRKRVQDASKAIQEAALYITYDTENQPYVAVENADVVKKARKAYDDLEKDGLASYVANQLPDLLSAEEGYANAHAGQLFVQAYDHEQDGAYQEAIDIYRELLRTYPGHETYESISQFGLANCLVAQADAAYKKKDYEDAMSLYQQALNVYPSSLGAKEGMMNCTLKQLNTLFENEEYEAVKEALEEAKAKYGTGGDFKKFEEKLEKQLKKIRPKNGKVFANEVKWGYCKFRVKAGDKDVYVKLVSSSDPDKYVIFYVRAGETASVKVGDGKYIMKYATGDTWYGKKEMFGKNTVFTRADGYMEFETTRSGSTVYYSELTITLRAVIGGNLGSTPISGKDF